MTCYKSLCGDVDKSLYASLESPVCVELMERLERLLKGQKSSQARRVPDHVCDVKHLLRQLQLLISGDMTD